MSERENAIKLLEETAKEWAIGIARAKGQTEEEEKQRV